MSWKSIVGQAEVVSLLKRAVTSRRVPQAMLLDGQDGYGTLALAIELARALTCERTADNAGDACGECRPCKQSATLQHPDIMVICALPSGKSSVESDLPPEVLDELAGLLRDVASDPFQPFGLAGATQIRIGQIRELKRKLSLSSLQGGKRVVIIHHAEDMTIEAANAFLKTLEEPHADVVIIATSNATERLLPTITSRCQHITVPPLDEDDIVMALVRDGHDGTDAALVAPFSEGNLSIARSYLNEDVKADREEAVSLLRAAMRGRDYRIELVETVNNACDKRDRQRAVLLLRLLTVWLRDVQCVLAMGRDASIVNGDQRQSVVLFAESFGSADPCRALDILESGVRDLRRNVTANTVLLTTLIELRRLFHESRRSAA